MAGTSRNTKARVYEVVVSFDGLNKGERFSQPGNDLGWALQRVESGYLVDVTDEPVASEAQGSVAPEADPERVEAAQNAGEAGKG